MVEGFIEARAVFVRRGRVLGLDLAIDVRLRRRCVIESRVRFVARGRLVARSQIGRMRGLERGRCFRRMSGVLGWRLRSERRRQLGLFLGVQRRRLRKRGLLVRRLAVHRQPTRRKTRPRLHALAGAGEERLGVGGR